MFGEYDEGDEVIHKFSPKDSSTKLHGTTEKDPFLIGFEIEKEDRSFPKMLNEGFKLPKGWICVKEDSLYYGNGTYGFELVTPAYNLTSQYRTILKSFDQAKDFLNANYTGSCGGHISVSKQGLSGVELAKIHKPMLSFFIALFPSRLKNRNINKLTFNESIDSERNNIKHKPFHCTGPRFELRMINAVKSKKQLIRRMKTIKWFLENEPTYVHMIESMVNKNGELRKLYRPVYGLESWQEISDRLGKLYEWFTKGSDYDLCEDYIQQDYYGRARN